MSKSNTDYYYEVALALPATWKQHIYTYSSNIELTIGTIVFAPFGSSEKIGVVMLKTSKPSYDTKPIVDKLDYVLPNPTINFMKWITDYYPGTPGVHIQHFAPSFLKKIPKNIRVKTENSTASKPPDSLTTEQQNAFIELTAPNSPKSAVLHGITGSGKTRLYCELAQKNMESGKDTLILYPEISLTTQLEQTLKQFFGSDKVLVYHSKRTPAEQRSTWLKIINSKEPIIVIGPRSALFLPYKNLGQVIIDEAHDGAYKQDSGTRYNGIIAAGSLARQHDAGLLLGSATPPVQETEQILSKGGKLVCMHKLAKKTLSVPKNFHVIDMTKSTNRSQIFLLSKTLMNNIKKSLGENKQSLLFLNKRGTARILLCEDCGWHSECPNCEMPLTHHHDTFTLQCHVCGYKQKSIINCPDCSQSLSLKNPGIKSVEQDLNSVFPDAKIARFDSDNKKQDTFQENYDRIKNGEADIIIGTQLLTKGLDLPLLDTVGILQADSSLLLPDYTSEERTFQQLTQVSGRVGRGHSSGTVIVQSFQPDSYIFPFVESQNWHGFYELELAKRKQSGYPPYSFAMKIWVIKSTREKSIEAIEKLHLALSKNKQLRILGPAPSFYEKSSGKYSWQIVVISNRRNKLTEIVPTLPKDFFFDLDPTSFL